MKTIVMDTANKYLAVGLYENDICLGKFQDFGNRRQSEQALEKLQELLKSNHMEVLDFDEFVITIGPGSYTGVRVALTIAKTICATTRIRIKTVSTLKAMVDDASGIAIIDARSNKAYLAVYKSGETVVSDCLVNVSEIGDYQNRYPELDIFGDLGLIGQEDKPVDLVENIYKYSKGEKYVENSDNLVPYYIKEVFN
ncbi:MAG: tRNA (adenosine(37)-N6)-threonylcarbamoyltransferase complex dimerization subunit type 1 TsaB [Erysipelotrichaceae bacterium]|nr:tRNA (adenosine(37)-N6)-threonylcarbamoyltransferase complex dimerization subunit type 1 TsaB [Erysipelotrichaceae bacterium]MDD3810419.1 tRNA (adenosine(37)-N6)-threonylcarbamoyltransferase complex dimerization subunit type 1 TsaB [Erysipelotrichaceae bacterium]